MRLSRSSWLVVLACAACTPWAIDSRRYACTTDADCGDYRCVDQVCVAPGFDGGSDAGADAGTPDAGGTDAGGADAGSSDAGGPDAGSSDAGDTDAGADAGAVATLELTPGSFDFGNVSTTASGLTTFVLRNAGTGPSGSLTVAFTGPQAAAFREVSTTCLAAGLLPLAQCDLAIGFQPGSQGPAAAQLSVTGRLSGAVTATLAGTGTAPGTLSANPTVGSFGGSPVGVMGSMLPFTITNNGASPATGLTFAVTGASTGDFAPVASDCTQTLAASTSCTASYRFTPSAPGTRTATLSVSATGVSRIDVPFSGLGQAAALEVNPTAIDFGAVGLGTAVTRDITVSNPGQLTTGNLSSTVTGLNVEEVPPGTPCPAALAPGTSCTMRVRYAPTTYAALNGTLVVRATPLAATTTLAGSGVDPALHDFGLFPTPFPQTVVGTPTTAMITLRNTGGVPAGVPTFNIVGPGAPEFSVVTNGCTTPLPALGSCTITLSFRAQTAGEFNAQLQSSASPGGMASVGLAARALAPATLRMFEFWPPPAQPVVLYFPDTSVTSADPPTKIFMVANMGELPTGPMSVPMAGTQLGGGFSVVAEYCTGRILGPTELCGLTIRFAPTGAPGTRSAMVTVQATPGGSATGTVSGNAVP